MFHISNLLWFMSLLLISLKVSGTNPSQERHESCSTNNAGIVPAINDFGFAITRQIQDSENMFFSPLGLSMLLGMAYLGAKGKTAEQIEEALGFKAHNASGIEVHEGFRQLWAKLIEESNGEYTLNIANGFFSQLRINIERSYRDEIQTYYHAVAESLDFANQPGEAMNSVNEWASENTGGKVENFLAKPLPGIIQVLLIDAIYFKGAWKIEFPVSKTINRYFFVHDRKLIVPMMTLDSETFRYLKDEESGYKYLELPYKGDEICMLLALPLYYDQNPDLHMTNELLCRIMSSISATNLDTVVLPKFKLEYEKSMRYPLKEMGMVDAFQIDMANFTGIREGLYISDILHKAVVEVNERGSEAAAVSGFILRSRRRRIVDEFTANRPFLFYILHKDTNLILFSGKVITPSEV